MSFEDLPTELLVQIFEYIPYTSHIRAVPEEFSDMMNYIEQRVFENPNKYIEELSPPVYFLLKYKFYHKLIWDKAISKGNLNLVVRLDKLGYKFNANVEFENSAKGGHKDLVEFFIEKCTNDWNWGMAHAAGGGHKELVKFCIAKGANFWNLGMRHAARGGYKDLVEFFIEKGAKDWNAGMAYAARGGHKDFIKFFIEKGADDWYRAIHNALEGGHKDLVIFFKEKLKIKTNNC